MKTKDEYRKEVEHLIHEDCELEHPRDFGCPDTQKRVYTCIAKQMEKSMQ